MFTGIVEELGTILRIEWHKKSATFFIQSEKIFEDVKTGDSISINGCCLTLVNNLNDCWTCEVAQETLHRTNLKHLKEGDRINLERAVRFQDRMGGHLVQGHVDETGLILTKNALDDGSWWITIQTTPQIMRYLIFKGSIAVDGVSLTIANIRENSFSFAMIPHTAKVTTLGFKRIGEEVNLEVDLTAKYIEKFMIPVHVASLEGELCQTL